MVKTLGLCLLGAALASAQTAPNSLTPAEKAEGWKLLFDGKSLDGWTALPTSDPAHNGDWSVQNGALSCPGTSPGWLASSESFNDFHLRLQFRGAQEVNSGVFLRSKKEGQPHLTGYELQIWDAQPQGYLTGGLVGSVKAPPAKIIGGQWNDYDITTDGDHFVVVLNGKTVLDAHDAAHRGGLVGFQCQLQNKIEFRTVRILPDIHHAAAKATPKD